MTLPMMPHAMRPSQDRCPHCGSFAGTAQDEWGYTYCQDCDKSRDGVADIVAREREKHSGGPRLVERGD